MAGFEEEALGDEDFVTYLDRLQKRIIVAKYAKPTAASTTRSQLKYDAFYPGTSVLRKVPQASVIELFRLPGDPEQPWAYAAEKRSEDVERDHFAAFYSLYLEFALEALKASMRGESTRPFEILSIPHHGTMRPSPRAGWLEQRRGRGVRITAAQQTKTANEPTSTEPWDQWFKKLYACFDLDEGWNGDCSPPPQDVAIYNASVLLKVLRDAQYEPTRIAASAMGGVAITRKVGNRKVLVECYNDGRVYFLFSDRASGSMDVKPLSLDRGSLTTFIASMREFLNG
jgi:hypothetical protein